jgi:cell wall-associated NlpC family hydrolase
MLTPLLLLQLSVCHTVTQPSWPTVDKVATAYLGEHYVWGDIGESGFDCSGFVQAAYRQAGIELPRSSREQAHGGIAVALADVHPGDLLFFTSEVAGQRISHVGLALPGNKMIHAARGHHRVVISRWDSPYFLNRWVAARRYANERPMLSSRALR